MVANATLLSIQGDLSDSGDKVIYTYRWSMDGTPTYVNTLTTAETDPDTDPLAYFVDQYPGEDVIEWR